MAKKPKKLHPGGFIGENKTKDFFEAQRKAQKDFMAAIRRQQRGQKQNPMMPTAGMSQGRPATGRTPMPGPAPDPERMKRFQKLMRDHAKRMNAMRKAQMTVNEAARKPLFDVRKNIITTASGEKLTQSELLNRAFRSLRNTRGKR